MNPEEKVLPLKEEAPKEEGKPLSKDNEPKTAKAKGGKDKSSVSQKNARAREKAPREPAETDTPRMAYQGGKTTSPFSGRILGAKHPKIEGCFLLKKGNRIRGRRKLRQ
jgi:hypothetical protein